MYDLVHQLLMRLFSYHPKPVLGASSANAWMCPASSVVGKHQMAARRQN